MEVKELEVVKQPEKPVGRAAFMEMYKAANPKMQGDPDDEGLMGFAHERYADLDGKYNELLGANTGLADLVSKDPRLGAAISMMVGDKKSLPYAVGNVFGREWLDGDLEEFEKGYQENLARLAESEAEREQAAKNIEEYKTNLEKFKTENGLTDQQVTQLNDAIYTVADNMLMGVIPVEFIEAIWKGLNYDQDVEEAAVTGEVEGRNQAIEVKKKKITGDAPLPDLVNGTGAGKSRIAAKPTKRGSFFDEVKEDA